MSSKVVDGAAVGRPLLRLLMFSLLKAGRDAPTVLSGAALLFADDAGDAVELAELR